MKSYLWKLALPVALVCGTLSLLADDDRKAIEPEPDNGRAEPKSPCICPLYSIGAVWYAERHELDVQGETDCLDWTPVSHPEGPAKTCVAGPCSCEGGLKDDEAKPLGEGLELLRGVSQSFRPDGDPRDPNCLPDLRGLKVADAQFIKFLIDPPNGTPVIVHAKLFCIKYNIEKLTGRPVPPDDLRGRHRVSFLAYELERAPTNARTVRLHPVHGMENWPYAAMIDMGPFGAGIVRLVK